MDKEVRVFVIYLICMGFFQNFIDTPEKFYSMAVDEINAGHKNVGLWAKSLSKCEGDEKKGNALYLKLRALELHKEQTAKEEKILHENLLKDEAERNNAILAVTSPVFVALLKTSLVFGLPTLVGLFGFKGFPVLITFVFILSAIIKYDRAHNGKEDKLFLWLVVSLIVATIIIMVVDWL